MTEYKDRAWTKKKPKTQNGTQLRCFISENKTRDVNDNLRQLLQQRKKSALRSWTAKCENSVLEGWIEDKLVQRDQVADEVDEDDDHLRICRMSCQAVFVVCVTWKVLGSWDMGGDLECTSFDKMLAAVLITFESRFTSLKKNIMRHSNAQSRAIARFSCASFSWNLRSIRKLPHFCSLIKTWTVRRQIGTEWGVNEKEREHWVEVVNGPNVKKFWKRARAQTCRLSSIRTLTEGLPTKKMEMEQREGEET